MLKVDEFAFERVEPDEVIDSPEFARTLQAFADGGQSFQCYAVTFYGEETNEELPEASAAVYSADAGRICFQYGDYVGCYDVEAGFSEEDCEGIEEAITVWIKELRALLSIQNLQGTYNAAAYTQLAAVLYSLPTS